jgi:hypothetical protein
MFFQNYSIITIIIIIIFDYYDFYLWLLWLLLLSLLWFIIIMLFIYLFIIIVIIIIIILLYIYTHYKLYYILLHIAGTQQFSQLAPKFAKCMAKFYRVWMAQLTQLSPLQLTYIFFGRSVGRILVIHVIVGFSGTPFSDSTISIYIP